MNLSEKGVTYTYTDTHPHHNYLSRWGEWIRFKIKAQTVYGLLRELEVSCFFENILREYLLGLKMNKIGF